MKNLIEALQDVIRLPVVETLGWTLLHFVWQGALIALILAALLWLLKNHHPSIRYGLSCASLALMFVCPIITYLVLDSSQATRPIVEELPPQSDVAQPTLVADNEPVEAVVPVVFVEADSGIEKSWLERYLKPLLPYFVVFWGMGVLVLSVRLLGGLWYLRNLRTRLTEPVSAALMSQLKGVAERLGLARTVQLRESLAVTVPLVVGWIRPMILLPSSVISGLSVKQLEMILAHELAHIRRHDYLINLLQSVIEVLLFYHPAVWWTSAKIRHEREHCCDDIAVSTCGGNKQIYAETLADLDKLRRKVQLAQAATGGSLLKRIVRLVDKALPKALEPKQWLAGLSMIAVSIVLFTVIGLNLSVAQDDILARLRVGHFIFNGPNVDILVNGEIAMNPGQAQADVPEGFVTGYLELSPGTYSVAIVPTGKGIEEALIGPTDVQVETGHRYILAMMGQLDDNSVHPLVIDETAVLQKSRTDPKQQTLTVINNVAGTTTIDFYKDGGGPQDVKYGDFGTTSYSNSDDLPCNEFTIFFDNTKVASGPMNGQCDIYNPMDFIVAYFGHFPGTLDEDFFEVQSSNGSDLNALEFLKAYKGLGYVEHNVLFSFDTFLAGMEKAGLTDMLTTGGPYLMLIPTDQAFADLPKDQFDKLMADPQALADVLRYTIFEGYYPSGSFSDTSYGDVDRTVKNMRGDDLKLFHPRPFSPKNFRVEDAYQVFINEVEVGASQRYQVANGTVLRAISRVLLPPTQ